MLKSAKYSSHHGVDNQLQETMKLLDQNPNIDMLEIDFVCINDEYISSHDYSDENVSKGSKLEDWVNEIVKRNKVLWLDLKDETVSIFFNLSKLNMTALGVKLFQLYSKYPQVLDLVMVGCQYSYAYNNLISMNLPFKIVNDLPKDTAYVADYVSANISQWLAGESVKIVNDDIVALDRKFFPDLKKVVDELKAETIIIYNYEPEEEFVIETKKHVIYQFSF